MITTYDVLELLGTKIRALYQRSKGRDLFDLYYASQHMYLDYGHLMRIYQNYMNFAVSTPPSYKQFLHNINSKELSSDFLGDMEGLLRPGIDYNHTMAFEWLRNEVLEKINNFT